MLGDLARQGESRPVTTSRRCAATSPATSTSWSRCSPRVQIGWDREHVGSHVVRRNTIYDCGQNGIVGHLGCVFSTIEDNHIYNIAIKREFYGYEIGGIKLHAALDVIIRHNRIHDCSLGTWLDWQTQGTRVSRNLFYANNRDLFVEVSHGPYLVDHNIFASPVSLELFSQGGAFVNNLVCGTLWRSTRARAAHAVPRAAQHPGRRLRRDQRRRRPLHRQRLPRRRPGAGLRARRPAPGPPESATAPPATTATRPRWRSTSPWSADPTKGDHERFTDVKQPVYIRDNVYARRGQGVRGREGRRRPDRRRQRAPVVDEGDAVYLETTLPAGFDDVRVARRQRGRPRAGALRRRGLRGTRRHPGRPGHRPGWASAKDSGRPYPAGPDHRPRRRRLPRPRLVT